jgi:hypothetical protein
MRHAPWRTRSLVAVGVGLALVGDACMMDGSPAVHNRATGSRSAPVSSTPPLSPGSGQDGQVESIAAMSRPRAAHTATRLSDGRVLVAGGFGTNGGDEAGAELFDPRTGQFTPAHPMSVGRQSHTATLLSDGRVLIVGGYDPAGERLPTAELYDPETQRFSLTGSMAAARADHTATLLDDGRVLIVGGTGAGFTFLATAELYDPSSEKFVPTGPMSVPRESATATRLADGRVLVAGGHAGRHEDIHVYATAELFDLRTGRFRRVGDMVTPRHKHDAVLLADGRVLIVGGSDARDDLGLFDPAEIFDPATESFLADATLHAARYKMRGTTVVLADGQALICCGTSQAEVFDPVSDSFHGIPGSVGDGPLFAAAARVGPQTVLVTGGYSLSGPATAAAWLIEA